MKKFKIKNMKTEMLEGIAQTIHQTITTHPARTDVDRMLFSVMGGLVAKFHDKLNPYKRQVKYSFDLSAPEAFGWRILYWNYCTHLATSVGNTMRMVSDEIDKYYQ